VGCGVRLLGVLLDLDGYPYTRFDGVDFAALRMEGGMQAAFAVGVSGEEGGQGCLPHIRIWKTRRWRESVPEGSPGMVIEKTGK
jgi:hypothetical protein